MSRVGIGIAIITIAFAIVGIVTFGLSSVLIGMVTGAVMGGILGGLNAAINNDNILYGILSGAFVGALSGIVISNMSSVVFAAILSGAGAFSTSLIGDSVNGRESDYLKAVESGITAGLFSFLGNGALKYVSQVKDDIVIKIITNSMAAVFFNSYNFIADTIFDAIRRKIYE